MKKYNKSVNTNTRRKEVINRLDNQLKLRTKNTKEGVVALTDKDVTRIESELEILKSRI